MDGGYYLIGAREPLPGSLFAGIPWSSDAVAAETLRRARDNGLRLALLPTWYDVDDGAGLARLAADRALSRAPQTRAALSRLT